MSEVKRYTMIEVGLSYHKRTEMEADEDGSWVYFEDYAALQLENKSNLKSAHYAAETNRKVVRTNEVLSDNLSALQQKLDAVLAENARMLSDYRDIPEMRRIGAPLTPSTDAILNEVRAEAVGSLWRESLRDVGRVLSEIGAYHDASEAGGIVHDEIKERVDDRIAQLRAGSTEGATK